MAPRKRTRDEMESSEPPKETSLIEKIRNMWEFASTMQFIFMFGKVVKIDEDFDIEDFETECLKPGHSEKLEEIGLNLLKWISSHRGLNFDIWDEYTRRQYLSKASHLNPYGDDEEPKRFRDFDIFQKIRVLHQLTVWTLWNPDRLRERMPDHQREVEQLDWRIEELGYDREERNYYLLDDNRLYRRTDPPLPPAPKAKPKATSLKAQAARRRASKRRRIVDSETPEVTGNEDDSTLQDEDGQERTKEAGSIARTDAPMADTFGGFKWELIAINLTQYQDFCEVLRKSKDPNEKSLRTRILADVIPIIEAAEEKQRRKIERRERELLTLEKMATAKRSSRLADRQDRERQEKDLAEAERKRAHDLAEAHREQERQEQMDRDRQSRMMTREQRIKDREYKRILAEEELARAAEEQKRMEAGEARGSERQLKEKLERKKKELEDLQAEEEWTFDCSGCGVHGKNLDDGSHSVACEKCSVWQHSKCLGISKAAAEKSDFHFVCKDCKEREEDAKRPKISLKFRNATSSSPPQPVAQSIHKQQFVGIEIPKKRPVGRPPSQGQMLNGYQQVRPNPSNGARATSPQKPAISNSYLYYTAMPTPHTTQWPQYPDGIQQQPRPSSSSPVPPQPHVHLQDGHAQRPGSLIGQPPTISPYAQLPRANNYNYSPQSGVNGQHSPYYEGVPHQYQGHPVVTRPPSLQPLSRPAQHQGVLNGQTPIAARVPSPIANPPTMSPTQGNYDVGPVAGIPQKSPPPNYHPALFATPSQHQSHAQSTNGTNNPTTPAQFSPPRILTPNHMSGVSPTKHSPGLAHRSPSSDLPPPSAIPRKSSASTPLPPPGPGRIVSGTPIFPPVETLAPSPEQLSKTPVPTPSKQMVPERIGESELKRVSEDIMIGVTPPVSRL